MEVKEPLGSIAILCGHTDSTNKNSPLLQFVLHLVAAISYGNSVIIVPDERFPLPALDLYEIFDTSDMPGGVVNILTGNKQHLAKYLSEHQQVSAVWYLYNVNDEQKLVEEQERFALQFLGYTSSFSLKRNWFMASSLISNTELLFNSGYLNELELNSTQSKFVYVPIGTIFAN
jgi:aldehyde dehydrogenase (NAD+)